MPFAPSSFLLLVQRPGAPSSLFATVDIFRVIFLRKKVNFYVPLVCNSITIHVHQSLSFGSHRTYNMFDPTDIIWLKENVAAAAFPSGCCVRRPVVDLTFAFALALFSVSPFV